MHCFTAPYILTWPDLAGQVLPVSWNITCTMAIAKSGPSRASIRSSTRPATRICYAPTVLTATHSSRITCAGEQTRTAPPWGSMLYYMAHPTLILPGSTVRMSSSGLQRLPTRRFRMCYGAELSSVAILRWSQERQDEWHYIAPGKPT